MECVLLRQDKQINPEDEFKTFEDKVYSQLEAIFDILDHEEAIALEELKTNRREKDLITVQDGLQNTWFVLF